MSEPDPFLVALMRARPGDDVPDHLADIAGRPPWHALGRCSEAGVDMFATTLDGIEAARTVCAPCPVRQPCAEAAVNESHGVWAATTPQERRAARQIRSRSAPMPGS